MYNVRLNKTALQSGRDFVKNFVTFHRAENLFPGGTAELLAAFLAQAQENWVTFVKYLRKDYSQDDIFGRAVKSITLVTVACELVSELDYVLRMDYAPWEGESMSDAQRQFANDSSRMLAMMADMVGDLQIEPSAASEDEDPGRLLQVRAQRLAYAKHLADLAVVICKPNHGSYQHPGSSRWLGIRARIQRKMAAELIDSARADEACRALGMPAAIAIQ